MTISHNGRVFLLSGSQCHALPASSMLHICSTAGYFTCHRWRARSMLSQMSHVVRLPSQGRPGDVHAPNTSQGRKSQFRDVCEQGLAQRASRCTSMPMHATILLLLIDAKHACCLPWTPGEGLTECYVVQLTQLR